MRGVVRPHCQLVDQQTAVAGLEQLDGQDPDDVQLAGGDGEGEALRFHRQSAREARCRRDDLDTDSVPLNGLDDWIGDGLP